MGKRHPRTGTIEGYEITLVTDPDANVWFVRVAHFANLVDTDHEVISSPSTGSHSIDMWMGPCLLELLDECSSAVAIEQAGGDPDGGSPAAAGADAF